MAELWAVRDGLSICVDRNFHAVIIEMDALAIIEAITNPSQPNAVLSAIVKDCRQLASRIPWTRFSHCFREANKCAYHLAKTGTRHQVGITMYDSPPADLEHLFDFDASGLYLNRRCPESLVFC